MNKTKILLVDDEPEILNLLEIMLESEYVDLPSKSGHFPRQL